MRKWLKLLAVLLVTGIFSIGLFSRSDESLRPDTTIEDKPYYVAEDAVVAELGGLGLTLAEYRYQLYEALTEDMGLSLGQIDFVYDEAQVARLQKLALNRAARWRAVSLLAMDEGFTPPEPQEALLQALCKEPYVTSSVAESRVAVEALQPLLFLARYGRSGSSLPDETAERWGRENGVMSLRALWLNADSSRFSEAEIESRWEQMDIFLRQLRIGDADFDTLCSVYSEREDWPKGKQIDKSADAALYAAADSLREGSYGLFRMEDGLYLLLRCPLSAEEMVEGKHCSLRELAAGALFEQELQRTADGLMRRDTTEWKRIRLDMLFEKEG